jgi:hypothetical protein
LSNIAVDHVKAGSYESARDRVHDFSQSDLNIATPASQPKVVEDMDYIKANTA